MLKVEHLVIRAAAPISFEVADGACMVIEGPSGSGKTSILRALADLDPVEGFVFVDGAERMEMSGPEWRRLVRYAAAEPAWWSATPRAHFPADAEVDIERLIASLGLPRTMLDQPLAELSTGERLRLALARSLAGHPKVLLFDEPTAALDPEAGALAEELIRFQKQAGRSVVLVTHDAGQASRLGDFRLGLSDTNAEAVS